MTKTEASAIRPFHVSFPEAELTPTCLPRRSGLRIVLFEACSAFTRVAACTLGPDNPFGEG
jgi:hypothetical protein